ncbi:hypothetical protein ACQPZF_00935 [Actinosynnema sp. CS-041913]|uniref:hypothetical protein n=1 Tax=Actinosynnema sp. CS-041913 TaxID=3239917 RepID=UPI003D89CA4A
MSASTVPTEPTLAEVASGALVTATVANGKGDIPVVAETTTTPGLLVAPTVRRDEHGDAGFVGDFNVLHTASGKFVWSNGHLSLQHARAIAAALAGPDWTRDQHHLTTTPEVKARVLAAYTALFIDTDF